MCNLIVKNCRKHSKLPLTIWGRLVAGGDGNFSKMGLHIIYVPARDVQI